MENTSASGDGPSMQISLPDDEWFDEMYGPMMNTSQNERSSGGQDTPMNSKLKKPNNSSTNVQPHQREEVVELSDSEEEQTEEAPKVRNRNGEMELFGGTSKAKTPGHSDSVENGDQKQGRSALISPEEMRSIVLTQAQLKQFALCTPSTFKRAVVGCFVRVYINGLPEKHKDLIFIDKIIDVLEPTSYQHFWFSLRLRLQNFGDFEIDKIHGLAIQKDDDLRSWFSFMKAKGKPLPTHKFVRQKKEELAAARRELDEKNKVKAEELEAKMQIKRADLAKIVLSEEMLLSLSKLDFERFSKAVVGSYVCMQTIRNGKPENCQYQIVRVAACKRGPNKYKVRDIAKVDYQLVFPFYGDYVISWLDKGLLCALTDAGFRQWTEDIKSWGEPLPTMGRIDEKAAELQMALNEASSIPSYAEQEKQQKEEEEKTKRATCPIRLAQDLDSCLLTRQNLQRLAALSPEEMERTMAGAYIRLKVGASGKQFQIDQIRALELVELKPREEVECEPSLEECISIELKFGGGTSLKELINQSSVLKVQQHEFDEWLRKMHADKLGRPIPTYGQIEKKRVQIAMGLEAAEKKEAEQKTKAALAGSPKAVESVAPRAKADTPQKQPRSGGGAYRGGAQQAQAQQRIPKRSYQQLGGSFQPPVRQSQQYGLGLGTADNWRTRREVRETPGMLPGWSGTASGSNSRSEVLTRASYPTSREQQRPLVQRVVNEPSHIDFVREQAPWVAPQRQREQIQQLLNSRLSRHEPLAHPTNGLPGESPTTFFARNSNARNTTSSQKEMERSLGIFNRSLGGDRFPGTATSSDVLNRALPNERFLPQAMAQRGSSTSFFSSTPSTFYAAPQFDVSSPSYFSTAAPKRSRELSPQAPPVHRFY